MARAILAGKLYDTQAATEIAARSNGRSLGDHRYLGETLYRTPSGHYYLYGCGGANTEYARESENNSYTGGSGFRSLDLAGAIEWLDGMDPDEMNLEAAPEVREQLT